MTHLDVAQEMRPGAIVLCADGEVDTGTVEILAAALEGALAAAATRSAVLVVDLDAVSYFGSAGLNALLDGAERADVRGVALRVVATNSEVTRPIEVTRLQEILRPYPSLDEAMAATGGAQ
ncbi:anti-anti-sigma factor [Mycolicibacterium iranicum]|uniref:Anti-sigma factor antagonist n=1 Tax=Mycolicibacterium iranicum TaxID=912594 RepID=A0A839QBU3_MYCIR|nr:STAS domain-containing protein [Mycolicibacterium iranicum]MBB2991666.1 anti-anti-sigma factor [Mycolicibacterium iranicum]